MKIKIKKPSSSKVIWMLVFLAFLKPAYFGTVSIWDNIFDVIRILAVLVLAFYYFFIKKGIFKFTLQLLMFASIPLFVTVFNRGNLFGAFTSCLLAFGSAMIMDIASRKRNDLMAEAMYQILEILVYSNFIAILMFPNGLYLFETETGWISDQAWILGLRNAQTTYLMLACIVAALYLELKHYRIGITIRCICLYVVVFFTISTLEIGSGFLGFFVLSFMLIFTYFKKNICISFSYVTIGHVVLFFLMTSLGSLSLFSSIGDIVGMFLGRQGTVSARFYIWKISWSKVFESPILGHGIMNSDQLTWLSNIAAGASTTHNTFLDMWLRGGLICFILFCLVLRTINKRISFLKKENLRLYNIGTIGVLVFFIIAQAEGAMSGTTMYILLGLLWSLPNLIQKEDYAKEYR